MFILALIGAIIPMSIYLYFLWKFDKNEPEPIKFVIYHFLYGATIAIILGIIGSKIISIPLNFIFTEDTNNLLTIILVAPFVEEIAKATLLFKTIKSKNFDNLTDGLIYGGAIGLGFGMTENFLYFIAFSESFGDFLPLFILRTSFSAVMHCFSTASVGGLMGLSKYSSNLKLIFISVFALIIAMLIHFTWNFSIILENTFFIGIIFIIIVSFLFFLTYYFSLKYEYSIINKELKNEIPDNLLSVISSANKFKKGWFTQPYQNIFIQKATLLAFRKHQVDISDNNNELYNNEILQLRIDIAELLKSYKKLN